MNNSPLDKANRTNILAKILFENKVVILFVVLCIACIVISGTNLSYIASEVFTRFGRNTCLVLALIIPCLAGLGMNFGIVVGAIAAQIAIFWVVHWGFKGIGGFMLCMLIATPMALLFGFLVGRLYNKTKGAEMITGLVLGFFADGLYRLFVLYIIGGVIPFDDPTLLDRGFGLRNAFDLTGNLKYSLDGISFLTVLCAVAALMILMEIITLFHRKKNGMEINKSSFITRVAIGIACIAFSFIVRFIPMLNLMLGGSSLLLIHAVRIGAVVAVVYAIIMVLLHKVNRNNLKPVIIAGLVVLGAALSFVPALINVFLAVKLPAAAYAVICIFCIFNNWIMNTRLGQNMRTVGQSRSVATSAGINVDKTRVIATCISTVLAAWGQLVFLQNLGTFNTVQQQSNVGLYAIAAILVGGANVQKANNKQAIVGVFLFHTLFVVAPLAATKIVGDSAISEYIRMFISFGVIAASLAMHAWNKTEKKSKKESAETKAA